MIGWPRPYQRPISTKKEAEPFIRQLYAELPWARTPRQRDGASHSAEGFDKGKLQNGVLEVALTSLNRTGCKREQSVV